MNTQLDDFNRQVQAEAEKLANTKISVLVLGPDRENGGEAEARKVVLSLREQIIWEVENRRSVSIQSTDDYRMEFAASVLALKRDRIIAEIKASQLVIVLYFGEDTQQIAKDLLMNWPTFRDIAFFIVIGQAHDLLDFPRPLKTLHVTEEDLETKDPVVEEVIKIVKAIQCSKGVENLME